MQDKYTSMIRNTIQGEEFQNFILTEPPLTTLEVGQWVLSEKQLTVLASKDILGIEKIGTANGFIIENHRWVDIRVKRSEENKTIDDQTDHKRVKSICERNMEMGQRKFEFE